jgi:hypothetical protein
MPWWTVAVNQGEMSMAIQEIYFSVCSSQEPRKSNCESREIAMGHLDANIKRARESGGSAGMLYNGTWELHFPKKSMILFWVEDTNGEVQRFP